MSKFNIDALVWDDYIYPRTKKSQKTIDAYTEALGIGAEFPPIEVQRVTGYPGSDGRETPLILDGVHRWYAYKACQIEDVEIVEWQPEALDYETHKITLALEAAERNTRHGDRVTEGDKKATARRIAEDDPESRWTEEQIAQKLGANQQRINEWISDIRARQRASRDSLIIKLIRLGWTQQEIADLIGITRQRIAQIANFTGFGKICNLLSEGRSMEYVADLYRMDLALAWALRLDGKTDQERFQELGWGLRTWDDWRFNDCDRRFGDDWPGRIPAQLVAHALFYFTEPGDRVLDPMAGGGVVPDVCLAFGRECRAFDIAIRDSRPEIQYHYWQSGKMEWPCIKKPNFIFFDPPYYTKKEREYSHVARDEAVPLSSLSRETYLAFLAEFFMLAYENTRPTARMGFLNADWRDFESTPASQEDPCQAVTTYDYHNLLTRAGWQITHRIECPMSTERFSGTMVAKMQERRILGTVGRSLLIARKQGGKR